MTLAAACPGFADPVFDSQAVFRTLLHALAHPGTVCMLPVVLDAPRPLSPPVAAACLTLLDNETPVWLQTHSEAALSFLRFHCGCPVVSAPAAARFAIIHDAGAMPPLASFDLGTDEFPDRSATLVIQVEELIEGRDVTLRGPGIRESARLSVRGLQSDFWTQWRANVRLFPRGVDVIFATETRVAALARTTQVEG